jgi:hypothetical protein
MSTKARYEGGVLRYYDGTTFETVHAMAPLWWKDDFNNQALDTTNNWTLLDTGAATEALVEDAPNGVVALALDNTSEAQLAGPLVERQAAAGAQPGAQYRVSVPLLGAPLGVHVDRRDRPRGRS